MSDRIEGEDGATYGLSDAQSAIADFLAPQEDNAGRLQEQVDESDEGEADFDEDEYAEDALESDEEEAELDDDEYESEEEDSGPAETFTVKVNGEEVSVGLDELLGGYSRQADYTRKSQALSEERKSFEQDRNAINLERQQYSQLLGALQNQLSGMDEQAPDFDRMYDEDPIEAARLERQWTKQQKSKHEKLQAIHLEQQRVSQANQQYQTEQIQQVLAQEVAMLPDVIPEWRNEELAAREREELRAYLIESGVAEEELQALVRANHIKVLRKAMLYDKGQSRIRKAAKEGRSSKTVRPGSRNGQVAPSSRKQKNARQRLANSGRVADAAGLIESML